MFATAVVYAPQNKQQLSALVRYVAKNRPAINARKNAEYYKDVSVVQKIMRKHFAEFPPQLTAHCPWQQLGTAAMCETIAQKHEIPYWDVVSEANPY